MTAAVKKVIKMIEDNKAEYVDFRFTDMRGKWHHTTQHIDTVDEDLLTKGVMFDGSSIAGWKSINESDMILIPDCNTAVMDPFSAVPTLILYCDVIEPTSGKPYERDPRSIAKKAEAFLQKSKIADTAYFGPEAEFFIFDDVRFKAGMNESYYFLDSEEGPYNSGRQYAHNNSGHRPDVKGGYFPVPPVDSCNDIRAEMLSVMKEMGVEVEKHHHEVAPSQHELGMKFNNLLTMADHMQIYKYVIHNVAHNYGKTATFMPKPIFGDNGSGMHVHQSLWKDGKPLFPGNGYGNLSETALYYIGGILKHARTLNAFTNPTTNSYKRLLPGYEAPVLLAYSARNRSASIRIPYVTSEKAIRFEARFPDPLANPYLAFSALLMAGLDGIKNKISPGDAMDDDLYHLPPAKLKKIPTVCGSLRQALAELEKNNSFLTADGVFSEAFIESFIELKMQEVAALDHNPHPVEFKMYYSL